ncbi:MAG: hypothetical protein CMO55_24995 [Verrucomicrobiales bacterium]|nr:hypothetical protein [Verrucomicrobiales bacterium]
MNRESNSNLSEGKNDRIDVEFSFDRKLLNAVTTALEVCREELPGWLESIARERVIEKFSRKLNQIPKRECWSGSSLNSLEKVG